MTATALKFGLIAALYAPSSFGNCLSKPTPENPVVEFCTDESTVSLKIGDSFERYSKSDFTRQWFEIVQSWLQDEGVSNALLQPAQVHYWLSIPEANPAQTQMRLVITPQNGRSFMLLGSPFPEHWVKSPTRNQIAVLTDKPYPEHFGARVGSVLIEAKHQANTELLANLLTEYAIAPPTVTGKWVEIKTLALQEEDELRELQANLEVSALANQTTLNYLFEWVAHRELAFSFSWD